MIRSVCSSLSIEQNQYGVEYIDNFCSHQKKSDINILKRMKAIYGYACQSLLFPHLKCHNCSTMTYVKSLSKKQQAAYLKSKAEENLNNLPLLLQKNAQNNIYAFRLSDNLIPMADLGTYDFEESFGGKLEEIGKVANKLGMYLSFHPSQFFLLTSKSEKVTQNSIKNFNIFAKILSLMKLSKHPNIVTHVGAINCYSSMEEACDAFCHNFQKLGPEAKSYLVVENDQTCHSIDSCMYIHHKVGIPVVFDHAHYDYKSVKGISQRDAVKMAMSTWGTRTPKVHLCSQAPGVKIHNHADYIKPSDYTRLYDDLKASGVAEVIMMAEVKKKDEAWAKLWRQI